MGQGGCRCAALASGWKEVVPAGKVGNRFTHRWLNQGPTTRIPTSRTATGPNPLGLDYGTLVRSVKMDACSPGEVRAISCPVAERALKGAGRWYPEDPQYCSHHSDVSRALHVRPWVNGRDLDRGTHPRAGHVSEGRTHGARKPWRRAAPEATAMASIEMYVSTRQSISQLRVGCQWIRTP